MAIRKRGRGGVIRHRLRGIDRYDQLMVQAKVNWVKGRRIGFGVVAVVLVGAACTSWYARSNDPLSSPTATQDDSEPTTADMTVQKQRPTPVENHGNGTAAHVSAEQAAAPSSKTQPQLGIRGLTAPGLQAEHWYNLPKGRESIDVTDYRGKVIYLYGFQSWCPGCHRYGFPTLQELIEHYKSNDDVAFIAVQTTFEGYGTNTPQRAKETADRYDLTIPVGHSGSPQQPSTVMRRYRTGGTPWTVIINRDGTVRFNDFHIQPSAAVAMIDRLLAVSDQ